ncbi:hypothetical protein X777_08233 [Ooceraea biroi]|uniref:Uncharacterized protein n=1 Tax=Ooceraea biroi TaxID=2015173 RepID=A0A026WZ47_OOCBI|nr:hypothetical protein X777_08233 [Ooceraea biroi]
MTSRLRGPSAVKDTPKAAAPFAKDYFHRSEPEVHSGRSCKNGGRGSRYHFGMSRQHDNKTERNGRECAHRDEATEAVNADLLYRKSREHFGSWEFKDIVQDDARRSRRQESEDARLTNGKFRSEPVGAKMDKSQQDRLEHRDEGYVGSLPREDRSRGESVERELNGSHKSRKRESWEEDVEARSRSRTSKTSKSKDDDKDITQPVDERDILLKEIENLAIDGSQSPDRRIQAMIERLKSREESKLRSRREHRSTSPEKEVHGRTRSSGRSEPRSPIGDHSLDNDRGTRSRSTERSNEDRNEPRRDDSFRKRSDTYNADVKSHRRRSRENEEDHSRSRADSSKRKSYTYDGSPEDFDVRIQKYDRALLEPRRDLDRSSPRRTSPRDSNLGRKESFKEHDREPVTKKSSFRAESKRATSKDRGESGLTRKTTLKDQDNDAYKRHVSKSQHETSGSIKYFGKNQEELSRKDSIKDTNAEGGRKGYFKISDDEFGKVLLKDQHDDSDRKVSSKEHSGGVSRIVLRNFDDESGRTNSFKNTSEDSGGRNSFKEKNVEFGGLSYKDRENDSDRRKNSFKDNDGNFGRTCYQDYENNIDRKTANDRYIEFGKISFKTEDDELRTMSPFKAEDHEAVARASSFKEREVSSKRRVSLRNRGREALEKKPDSHYARPLSPLNKDELELSPREDNFAKDTKGFCNKAWHESNRMFSAKYLREHSKLRNAPEGRLETSPERGFSILQDSRAGAIEASANNPDEDRFGTRGGIDSGDGGSPRFSPIRDRNGATIIRIRSSEDPGGAERRRRRRPAQEVSAAVRRRRYEDENNDEDSEDEAEDRWRRTRRDGGVLPGRSGGDTGGGGTTPSRTIWNYREGGVLITDVEEGQPCLQCGEACPGFSPHTWR